MNAPEFEVRLAGERSNGVVSVVETTVQGGWDGPSLHRRDADEACYVLDGELTFQLGGELFTRRAGELAFALRGAHPTFANLSGAEARQPLICTPAGFERYLDRMAAEDAGADPPASALEPWPEVTVVGPRIAARQPE